MTFDESTKIRDVASVSVGYPFRGVMSETEGADVFVIQLKDASQNQGVDWPSCLEIQLTGKRKPDWVKPGDILFSSRGRNTYAIFIDALPKGKRVVAAPQFFIIRSKKVNVLPKYLAWLLNQQPTQRYFTRASEGTNTKSIKRSVIEDARIMIPSLQKQATIINLAGALKQEQQILEQLIHNGETIMNAVANDLFTSNPIKNSKRNELR